MRKVVFVALLCLFTAELQAQSPGGVSGGNLRMWLKANAGTFKDNGTTAAADGDGIYRWNDQSPDANNATQTTTANQPIYKTDIFNGNPVLRFNSDMFVDATSVTGIASNDNFHMFMVFQQNSWVGGGTTDGNGTFIIDRTTGTNNLMSFKMVGDKYYYQKRNDGGGNLGGPVSVTSARSGVVTLTSYFRTANASQGFGIIINGKLDVTSAGDADAITGPQLRIGRHAATTGGGLNGDFAEVIIYNAALSAAQRQKVESYLAIKYGITLDQTTAYDYLSSNGTVIYPATTSHDNYDLNIAGIGRDNTSGLNQTGSQSINTQSIVKIFNPSSLDNGDFLVWGNDAPVIWNSSDIPFPYVNRISRIWRAAETGEVGTFSISFDLTGLGMDMSDPTKFALLLDDNGVFGDATAYTTGRTIVGNVVTFTGADINNNDYFSLACPLIPGPGGVAATTVWVRADEEVYNASATPATNSQAVQQWKTKSGLIQATASQTTPSNQPTYITGAANGNPVIRFANTNYLDFGSLGVTNTSDLQMTLVFKPGTFSTGNTTDFTGSYFVDRTTNTTPIFSLKMASDTGNKLGLQEQADAGGGTAGPNTTTSVSTSAMQIVDFYRKYSVRYGILYNGAQQGTLAETGGTLTFPIPRLGASQAGNNGLDGDMAEFIFYNRDITTAERNRIDSYLAIKYGITLNQATLTDYLASDATVVYPAKSTHSGYISDIAGIGKDATSRLSQLSSTSANTGAPLTMSNADDLTDLEFFICGDNAGSIINNNSIDVGGSIKRRLNRVWRAAETNGDVGNVTMAFDLSGVGGPKNGSDLRLLIDRNFNGFADNDVAPVTGTLSGSVFTVTVNLHNKDLFTIGSTDITTTSLPIQLMDFNVSLARNGVLAHWETQSELNNDYFTLLRSHDGEKFEEATQVRGAGTTDVPQYYQFLDKPGAAGVIYYRLKQTDFDGKTSYSEIRKISLETVPFSLTLYPNPIDGSEFTTEVPVENDLVSMQMFNAAGQVVFASTAEGPVTKWNVGDLPKGIYFVKVVSNTGADVQKLVVR